MMNYIWAGMIIFSFLAAIFSGNLQALSNGITDGADDAVTIVLSLLGILMLWSGVMRIAEESGLTGKISKVLSPILKLIFKGLDPASETAQAISMNITANLLGLGSAATPLGIEAMKRLYKDSDQNGYASDNMIKFVVINTAAMHLIPTTIAMFRQKFGATVPMDILPASLVTSIIALTVGITMATILGKIFRKTGG